MKSKKICRMRVTALAMFSFLIGVFVGGDFPSWVKVVFPGLFVLLLSNYDDARIAMFEKGEE